MKALFILVFICVIYSVRAENYYFSSISGSDARTVAEARDPATPWKTLDKLNAFFNNLKPGDSVLLKRGESFRGSITVNKSGSITFPIVIGAYGSGSNPVVTSLIPLTGWVSKGNGIWESYNAALPEKLNMVLLNGTQEEMGRYPNSDAPNGGYLNFESHVAKTSITDNQLSTSVNWKGAELVLRPRHWMLDRSLITSQVGHKISYRTSSPYEPYENYGYFIQNSIKTLDKPGEWYYNPSTKKVSAFFGAKSPSSYIMQAATNPGDLVTSAKFSNVVFENITFKGSNGSGFNITDGSNLHIQNSAILFCGVTGVFAGGHANLHVENCTISDCNNNGIDLAYAVNNAVIKNNRIVNTAILAGMMQNGEGNGLAIYTNGDGNTIEANEILKTGFIGINFYGSDLVIKNNIIDSFCFVKDDGGGIYTHGGLAPTTNRKLIGNIVSNGVGAGQGTDNPVKRAVTGIYMDANTKNVEIRDNSITTCFQGILLQSTSGVTVKRNTVFNNVRQLTIVRDKDNDPVRNSVITQNIFFSKSPVQVPLYILSSANDIKTMGRFDSNYYARPLDDRLTIYTSYVSSKGTVVQNFNLSGWQRVYGQDMHSKRTAKQITPFKILSLSAANKFVGGGDFTDNIKGLSGSSCNVSLAKSGMLDGGYLQVVPSSVASSVYLKVGAVTAGKNYILRYSLRGSVANSASIGAALKQSGSPFTELTQFQLREIGTARTENEMVFTPSASQASTYIMFKVNGLGKYYLDNIKLSEAAVRITDPDDSIRFDYNAGKTAKTINLTGNYIDTKGKSYSGSVALQPFTSLILIKTNGATKNVAPTVTITTTSKLDASPLSAVVFHANAADANGSIAKVEFYNGSTLLTTEYKPTYDCTIDSLLPGNYSITAKATDDEGLSATSLPISFSVPSLKIAPAVAITSPATAAGFASPATVQIAATAADADGSIAKVEFFNGSTLLTTEYKSPYSYSWQNVGPGTYTLTAIATDNQGNATTSQAVSVSVKAPQSAGSSVQGRPAAIADNVQSRQSLSNLPAVNTTSPSPSDLAKLSAFRVSPNPAVNMIRLSFDALNIHQKVTLTVQNMSGAIVKKYPLAVSGRDIEVDITSLIPGTYVISIYNQNFLSSKKFVKVN